MSVAAIGFQRSPAPLRAWWVDRAWRALHTLVRALDRLVRSRLRDDAGPPPEWFKYPPI